MLRGSRSVCRNVCLAQYRCSKAQTSCWTYHITSFDRCLGHCVTRNMQDFFRSKNLHNQSDLLFVFFSLIQALGRVLGGGLTDAAKMQRVRTAWNRFVLGSADSMVVLAHFHCQFLQYSLFSRDRSQIQEALSWRALQFAISTTT